MGTVVSLIVPISTRQINFTHFISMTYSQCWMYPLPLYCGWYPARGALFLKTTIFEGPVGNSIWLERTKIALFWDPLNGSNITPFQNHSWNSKRPPNIKPLTIQKISIFEALTEITNLVSGKASTGGSGPQTSYTCTRLYIQTIYRLKTYNSRSRHFFFVIIHGA